jgi:hypothetical protein
MGYGESALLVSATHSDICAVLIRLSFLDARGVPRRFVAAGVVPVYLLPRLVCRLARLGFKLALKFDLIKER